MVEPSTLCTGSPFLRMTLRAKASPASGALPREGRAVRARAALVVDRTCDGRVQEARHVYHGAAQTRWRELMSDTCERASGTVAQHSVLWTPTHTDANDDEGPAGRLDTLRR
ncbi:hypothetical protein KILIM_016_00720 [Kineosphaera limosa NBRC 100340]|uniref:Uncharacterized protein n=1 Tax=Kineosphaera limosa NBRC 100340 TaxID=1184609 RepID=K6WSP8_9MICO|nr:hypothetical protein KILIM_016_00720 [Kineosphaera limosa NBRC 100340]